jgi:hypothetical protein
MKLCIMFHMIPAFVVSFTTIPGLFMRGLCRWWQVWRRRWMWNDQDNYAEKVSVIKAVSDIMWIRITLHIMWVPVPMARRVLELRMEETISSYGGQLWIYGISSRRQPTRGDPPSWELGEELTQPLTLWNQFVMMTRHQTKSWFNDCW